MKKFEISEAEKEHRIRRFNDLLISDSSPQEFWCTFNSCWYYYHDQWKCRNIIIEKLKLYQPFYAYSEQQDASFFRSMPEVLTIYRGCDKNKARGLSWTTESRIADHFAAGLKEYIVPYPMVYEATIGKSAILAAISTFDESEIVVDPEAIEINEYLGPKGVRHAAKWLREHQAEYNRSRGYYYCWKEVQRRFRLSEVQAAEAITRSKLFND